MPQIIKRFSSLQDSGPTIDITIYPPAEIVKQLEAGKIPIVNCVGLIDTGASISAIDLSIVKELNLISRDFIPVLTPSGMSNHFTYDIGIQLPKEMGWKTYFIEVTGCDLEKQPYKALIGRDILQNCTLIFNGWDNSFQLHI
jgi:hypothetical protein